MRFGIMFCVCVDLKYWANGILSLTESIFICVFKSISITVSFAGDRNV